VPRSFPSAGPRASPTAFGSSAGTLRKLRFAGLALADRSSTGGRAPPPTDRARPRADKAPPPAPTAAFLPVLSQTQHKALKTPTQPVPHRQQPRRISIAREKVTAIEIENPRRGALQLRGIRASCGGRWNEQGELSFQRPQIDPYVLAIQPMHGTRAVRNSRNSA
jgi:hypothetical protein